jgi:carbamoyltransferase
MTEMNLEFNSNYKLNNLIARNILQTSQFTFEQLFFKYTNKYLKDSRFKRILLTGGCALNVKLNTQIYEEYKKEVFVSPVPNDCGISIGAAISDTDIINNYHINNAFIGSELIDIFELTNYVKKYNGIKTEIRLLAEYISKGAVIGTLIGNIEVGPRALGNRSLLANPLIKGIKNKLNKIKDREFFRPVAPMVTIEMQNEYFFESPLSPYMSFAPKIREKYNNKLNEIVHYDETCRIQTVDKSNIVLYNLLKEFGKITGFEILINTSFNAKGKPILNEISEAFDLFNNSEMDGLFINGYYFKK